MTDMRSVPTGIREVIISNIIIWTAAAITVLDLHVHECIHILFYMHAIYMYAMGLVMFSEVIKQGLIDSRFEILGARDST